MNNFDRVILLGTSHTMPRWNNMLPLISKKYKIKFSNYGCHSIGIDSYFTRLHGITNNHFAERCLYLCEMPSLGRYQEFIPKEFKTYKPWDMIDGIKGEFWPDTREHDLKLLNERTGTVNGGRWEDYIYHGNIVDMADEESWSGNQIMLNTLMKSLARLKLEIDTTMEKEDQVSKMITLDGFIKSKKQSIVWFSVDNPIIYNKRAIKEFKKHSFRIINKNETLKNLANKLYGHEDPYEAGCNRNIYPDKHHFSIEACTKLTHSYIMPYLDKII